MPQTAVGTYATLAGVKRRMGIADSTDDPIITLLCDQMNGWIESFTGRILAPIPQVATVLVSDAAAGDTTVELASVTDLRAGDALLFGEFAGTHEHGNVASINRSAGTVRLQAPLVNAYSTSDPVERIQLFDGTDAQEAMRMIPVPNGIVELTALEVAYYTNGPFKAIPMQDVFLRPTALEREPGWPATELWMTDIPSSSNPGPIFFRGRANVRAYGAFGWPEIPDEIVDLAESGVVTRYRLRASGGTDTGMIGLEGERTWIRNLSMDEKETLRRYKSRTVAIV